MDESKLLKGWRGMRQVNLARMGLMYKEEVLDYEKPHFKPIPTELQLG